MPNLRESRALWVMKRIEGDVGSMEAVERIADALVRAVDLRDSYTGGHSESVAVLARRVGSRLGVRGMQLRALELAALLHDLGKLGVPDAILHKPGPLDEQEWKRMRGHSAIGAEMLAGVEGLEPIAPLVRWHHERWDGLGYPDGLAGEDIPIECRVVCGCDAFHAMSAERPYRAALDVDAALAELAAGAGAQFDPTVVEALRAEAGDGERVIGHLAVARRSRSV
jgi:HD-GYP domain-containing protein (c-di-GMP phosphodiesterase class II)